MGENIQVSVICNAFNHGKYIRDALEGFIKQKTNFTFEVLVHDDASTDNTAEIIREYEAKYPDIIKPIYQTENQYSKKIKITRTFQVPRIKGKYVALCEGDDYWTDPLKLQKQYDFMEANPDYTMCTCSTVWFDMKLGKAKNKCSTLEDRDVPIEEIILEKKGRVFQYATFFLRSDIFLQVPEWFSHFKVGDFPLSLHAASTGKVRMLADTMAVYRYGVPGSWSDRAENIDFRTDVLSKSIEGLSEFNKMTDYKYNEVIVKRIKMTKYNLARRNCDFKAMRSGELREIYLSKDLPHRMSDFVMCKFPKLHSWVVQILSK